MDRHRSRGQVAELRRDNLGTVLCVYPGMTDKTPAERPAGDPSLGLPGWAHGAVVLDAHALVEPPPPAEPPADKRLKRWRLKPDDQRMLWITIAGTFIGGVASIVVGAVMLAIAVAIARPTQQAHDEVASAIVTVICGGALLVLLWLTLRKDPHGNNANSPIAVAVMVGIASLGLGLMLLAWIGIAVGIK